jgi:hypothetical protein
MAKDIDKEVARSILIALIEKGLFFGGRSNEENARELAATYTILVRASSESED